MIVCDMCPDRTPATFRMTMETIDPELPELISDDPYGLKMLAQSMGLMGKANYRNSVALCAEHSKTISQDPEVGRVMLEDAIKANRSD